MRGLRITIVASEVLGRAGTGGAGTADSILAAALGKSGHRVSLVVATGREIGPPNDEWRGIYDASGVGVHVLETRRGVQPEFLRPPYEVYEALRADPPDVAVVNDWRGLGFIALRARQTGVALVETAFVVHCHGVGRVLAEFARKVPDTLARFGEDVAERMSLELADAVVSPTAWLTEWYRGHYWTIGGKALVIPYLRQSNIDGTAAQPPRPRERIRRLTFFGQLREGKGIRLYAEALHMLDPALLSEVELVFLGRESKRWTQSTIAAALPSSVRTSPAAIRFETGLERTQAIAELRRPGTLAVMPSLLDNAPNTVSECIENGIPFVSTRTGGIPELVAVADRERVLCDPDPSALAAALEQVLGAPDGVAPARAGADPEDSLRAWLDLLADVAPRKHTQTQVSVTVDVVVADDVSEERTRLLAAHTKDADVRAVRAASRREALERSTSEWIVFLDREHDPDPSLVDRLVAAQRASAADVVTCAVRDAEAPNGLHLFLGSPGALGLVENQYGVVALVRRELVSPEWQLEGIVDADWLLLSRLALGRARIVSIPEPLSTFHGRIGAIGDVPGDGLTVLETFEQQGRDLLNLPQLAATLAAAYAQARAEQQSSPPGQLADRGLRVLREEGASGVVRRVRSRLQASATLKGLRR